MDISKEIPMLNTILIIALTCENTANTEREKVQADAESILGDKLNWLKPQKYYNISSHQVQRESYRLQSYTLVLIKYSPSLIISRVA